MKKIYRLTLSAIGLGMALLPGKSWAQTGIGTGGSAPNTSAMLEVQSASKGLLIPRLSLSSVTDAVTIASPATSLLVWNTNNSLTAGVGYYFNAGTPSQPNWVKLVTNAPGDGTGNEWKLGGNTTGIENKFGTNDAFDLPFITGGAEKARLTTAGQFGIGTAIPKSTLEVAGSLGANYSQVTDATHAVSNSDFYVVYNGTTPGTFTLPTSVGVKGRIFYLKNNTSAQMLTVVGQTGEGINGTSSLSIPAGQSVQLITNGASSASITGYEVVSFNSATTIGGPQTASNGLTLLGTDVQLGGQLTKSTVLDGAGAYTLGLTNTTLGVGVAAPGATLHIFGATTSGSPGGTGAEVLLGTGNLTKGASVQIANDGAYGSSLLFNVKKGSNQGVTGADNWPTNATTAMRVGAAGGGNVGIGTFSASSPVNSGAILHLRNASAGAAQQQGFLMPTVDFAAATHPAATTWGLAGTPANGMQVASNTSRMDAGFSGPGIYTWVQDGATPNSSTNTWRRLEYGTGMSPALATLNCGTSTLKPSGIYVSGQALSSTNTVVVPVTVTQIGTYNIATPVANGYSFTGIGTFSATGTQNITLTASGTPTNAGNDNFTITLGGSTCNFTVGVGAQLAAVSSINCLTSGPTAQPATGIYQSTTPTTSANTKTITVNVTNGGAYAFTTNVVNGISFSATGTFADASAGAGNTAGTTQNVILYASGTPQQAPVTNTFRVSGMGGTPCDFTVSVIAAPVVNTLTFCATPGVDYRIKSTNGNAWIYPSGDATANNTSAVITNSTTGANRQWAFMPTGATNEYTLVNGGSTRVMSTAGTTDPANLIISDYANLTNQRFIVSTISGTAFTSTGVVELIPSYNTGQRVDVAGGATSAGTTISVFRAGGTGGQRFNLQPVADPLTSGTAVVASNNRFTVGYNGGNGGTYATQTVSSTGVQGLTATLAGGVLNGTLGTPGPGYLSFVLSGTPASAGDAVFAISVGGASCSVKLPVVLQDAVVTALDCANATTTGTVATGAALSGVTTAVAYTGGNGGKYPAMTIASTNITGLTATVAAGAIATGSGSIVLNISGTPSGDGTANFAFSLGGINCTVPVKVTRTPVIASFTNCSNPAPDYRLKVNNANSWIYAYADGNSNGTLSVAQSSTSTGTDHYWQFVNMGSNYHIRNAASGKVMDMYGGSTSNGTLIRGNDQNVSPAERWNIISVMNGTSIFAGATFLIASAQDGNKAIDVNAPRANNTAIYIFDADGNNVNQRFVLEPVSTLTAGTNSAGYNVTLGYTDGNGANYPGLSGLTSTGVTGLTASLAPGTLNGTVASRANGFLTFVISGTPSAAGTASFAFTFGGQSCVLNVATQGPAVVGSLNCNVSSAGTLSAGVSASGVTQNISYTGGNTGQYSISAASTGVTGLTATASGSVTNSNGPITLNISGTPDGGGTASFTFSLGGQSCTFTRPVAAGTISSVLNANEPGLDYNIKSADNPWYLYPKAGGTAQSTPIALTSAITGTNRQWAVVNTGAGYAFLNQGGQGYVMDIANGNSTTNSNAVQTFAWNNGATSQRWAPTPVTSGTSIYNSPIYLYPSSTTSYRLDVNSGTYSTDNNVQIYSVNNGGGQKFKLVPVATLVGGQAITGYNVTYNYTGGSGTYAAQSVASTGVTGLTATLAAGNFNANGGNSFLTYVVSGTPSGSGTATFSLTIGGKSVVMALPVN